MHKLLLLIAASLGLWATGCGGSAFEILEEDEEGALRIRPTEVVEHRRGPELGLRIRAEVSGYGSGSPNAFVQGRLLDEDGREIPCAFLQATTFLNARKDSAGQVTFEDSIVYVETEIIAFSQIPREEDGTIELFIPYHAWRGVPGATRMQIELQALQGLLSTDFDADIPRAKKEASDDLRVGYIRYAIDLDYPELHAAQVWVQYLALDTTAFDPHASDFSLLHLKPTYGFPDIFWNVGIDYQEVYRSPYFHNSISGTWEEASDPFYIDGRDAELDICVYDWDDEAFFGNRDDALSCWEGKLADLSRDARQPTRLHFGLVAEMGVVLILDAADPWSGEHNP